MAPASRPCDRARGMTPVEPGAAGPAGAPAIDEGVLAERLLGDVAASPPAPPRRDGR
ncbi:MAG: hypothetical protein QOC64_2123 [Solirubrobacteraceae bacterium]|nr:hypothetical protein [Solirubrobacteraceae bacterium]